VLRQTLIWKLGWNVCNGQVQIYILIIPNLIEKDSCFGPVIGSIIYFQEKSKKASIFRNSQFL